MAILVKTTAKQLHFPHKDDVEFALHPQHETSFDSEKRTVEDFNTLEASTESNLEACR